MSDGGATMWTAVTAIVVSAGGLLTVILQNQNAQKRVARESKQVSIVATAVDRKLDAIHVLVNSATSVLLKERVADKKRIADFSQTPEDISLWKSAVESSIAHEQRQAVLDALLKQQDVHDAERKTEV
jgi:hypothetical protein